MIKTICLLCLGLGTMVPSFADPYVFGDSPSGDQQLILNTSAGTLTFNARDTGWYNNSGFHDSENQNYIAGSIGTTSFNDYFVFDLGDISSRVTITSAELSIGNALDGYTGPSSLNYTNWDVTSSISSLESFHSNDTSIYNDLGSGTEYGSTSVSASNDGHQVIVNLDSAAISAIESVIHQDSDFHDWAVGGSIDAVPEPASVALFGTGLAALFFLRRRKSQSSKA